jgi:hypothetical protein
LLHHPAVLGLQQRAHALDEPVHQRAAADAQLAAHRRVERNAHGRECLVASVARHLEATLQQQWL